MTQAIPEIDVGGLLSPDLATRRTVAAQIGRACRDIGFLSVVNHGLEPLIAAVLEENRRFHARPLEQKLRLDVAATPLNRGYHPIGVHSTNPTRLPDLKEAFDIALDLPDHDPDVVAARRKIPRRAEIAAQAGAWRHHHDRRSFSTMA